MFNLKPLRSVFVWFFILGLYNYISIFNPKSRLLRIFYAIFRGFYITIMLLSIVVAIKQFQLYESFTRIHAFVFVMFIPNFIDIIDSWTYASTLAATISDINNSLDYLENNVNAEIHINKFVRDFHRKIFLSSSFVAFDFIYKLCVPTPIYTYFTNVQLSLVSIYKHFAILHAIFFVDLQCLILKSINEKINSPNIDREKECLVSSLINSNAMQTLHHIKVIYSSVWKIAGKINERFGCCLLFVLLNFAFIIIYIVMNTFIYIKSIPNYELLIIRE